MDTTLSVVVVSYNTAALLLQCLDSVLRALPPQSEVFVVDNASPDGSAALVRRAFPSVQLLANRRNRGFAAAANQALGRAHGRYVTLLNPDTAVHGDSLRQIVAFLDSHPDVGVAGAPLVYGDGRFQHSAFRFPSLAMAFLEFFPLNHRLTNSRWNGRFPPGHYDRVFEIDHPLGACMTVRRAALAEVGLLDEGFFLYCEEVDWCWRIKRAGWRVVHFPGALVAHHEARSTSQRRRAALRHLYRSRYRLYAKHRSRWRQGLLRAIVRLGAMWKVGTSSLQASRASSPERRRQARTEAAAYLDVLRL